MLVELAGVCGMECVGHIRFELGLAHLPRHLKIQHSPSSVTNPEV